MSMLVPTNLGKSQHLVVAKSCRNNGCSASAVAARESCPNYASDMNLWNFRRHPKAMGSLHPNRRLGGCHLWDRFRARGTGATAISTAGGYHDISKPEAMHVGAWLLAMIVMRGQVSQPNCTWHCTFFQVVTFLILWINHYSPMVDYKRSLTHQFLSNCHRDVHQCLSR